MSSSNEMVEMSMKTNWNLKKILQEDKCTVGSWITLAHPAIAEIMCRAGFDWLVVDLEHTVITVDQAADLIRVISLMGVTPLVRLTSNDQNQVKQVMDAGAQGILVPCVNTKKEAVKAVESVYYPPKGKRGVGLARAQGYGANFNEYCSSLAENTIVIVQIEHINALNNLDAIFSVEGVDAYIIGPYDLSASMGLAGQLDHPDVLKAVSSIHQIAKKHKIPGGCHLVEPDKNKLSNLINEGNKFIAYSVDIRMLDVTCREAIQSISKKEFVECI